MPAGNSCDPDKPPRYWHPEAWRLRCAMLAARERLPYHTADARLLDGIERWMLYTGKGQPVPGPWWTMAVALASACSAALSDAPARRLIAPWVRREAEGVPSVGGFAPIDLEGG